MNILYILRHNPWGIGGGCYACRCYLDAFTTLFADAHFDVCICKEYLSGDSSAVQKVSQQGVDATKCRYYENVNFIGVEQRSKMEKVMSPITGLLHRFDSKARELLKSKKYDYCIFDHNSIAGPLVGLCNKLGVKTIVVNHNCEAEYYRDNNDRLHRMMFLRHVKRAERLSYIGCDYNIFLTEVDKALFESLYGNSKTRNIVTGCFEFKKNDDSNVNANENQNENNRIDGHLKLVISGTIGNVQNMDGIRFFLDELLTCVPKEAEVIIAGKNPPANLSEKIKALNMTGEYATVTLIPNPENMLNIVNGCDIFVCPTRLGGGLKLRVMDGLRAGLPVIAHKVSARGYSIFTENGMLWSFEEQKGFGDSIKQIIAKMDNGEIPKRKIKEYAYQQFSFEEKVKMLRTAIV